MKVVTVAALVACTQLAGCWFVYIPGSVTRSIGDAFTGASGEHCVGRSAKVGDRISLAVRRVGLLQAA